MHTQNDDMTDKRMVSIVAVVFMVGAMVGSCSDDDETMEDETRTLVLEMDHQVVVPTSAVRIVLGGTDRVEADTARITMAGEVGDRDVDESFDVELRRQGQVGDLFVELDAEDVLWPKLEPGSSGAFEGMIEVVLADALGYERRGRIEEVSWQFEETLRPTVDAEVPDQLFVNASIDVEATGVLRPEEGQTRAVVKDGQMQTDAGHVVDLDGEHFPVAWVGERDQGQLRVDPAVIGVHPGELEATIEFENAFSDGTTLSSESGAISLESSLDPTFVADLSPEAASRGQLVELDGRGFVGAGGENYGMFLRFEGTVDPADSDHEFVSFEGDSAAVAQPREVVDGQRIRQDVWYGVDGRTLEGLGAVPGEFDGQITPVLFDEYGEVEGLAWEGEFEVLPTRQMVYLKYLPAFTTALDRFGLANVERDIRDRILEVVHRDYDGINIEFVETPPDDFAAYATVEIGGPDPTGNQAFGFDNTYHDQPKDTGNLYIDDYLGGINPETGEEFNNPYGGVFVESFAVFSPTIHPEMAHTSERFDEIFGPFMPELNGQRVRATEWPEGKRVADIEEAIRVFANVVGNTISHEMGHALGMAHFDGDWDEPGKRYHNHDSEGHIMDAGVERSFEQRAQLDGQGPETFSADNRAYLEEILPVQ